MALANLLSPRLVPAQRAPDPPGNEQLIQEQPIPEQPAQKQPVKTYQKGVVIEVQGIILPLLENYLDRKLDQAQELGADLVISGDRQPRRRARRDDGHRRATA